MGGGGGNSGPTLQQQQLQTQQALTNANLNLEENAQRKAILNAMQGTRVFRGSALSRAIRGDTPGGAGDAAPGPSRAQVSTPFESSPFGIPQSSLVDPGSGATPAGGSGGSGVSEISRIGGYTGGGSAAKAKA